LVIDDQPNGAPGERNHSLEKLRGQGQRMRHAMSCAKTRELAFDRRAVLDRRRLSHALDRLNADGRTGFESLVCGRPADHDPKEERQREDRNQELAAV
jgi:hypothetical protein